MAKNKTPEQQALEREVKKERKRAKQLVRRATKRGFSFPENIVPDLPKTITEATLRKYKRLTPEYLYSKAVYVSPEGITYTGSQRRSQERSESSQKAAVTRQRYYEDRWKRDFEEQLARQRELEAEKWLDYQLENDYNELWYDKPQETQQGYGQAPTTETRYVLEKIRSMIADWEPRDVWSIDLTEYKRKDRNLLSSTFEGIIAREGEEYVALRCQEYADVLVSIAEQVLYDSGDSYKTRGVDGVNQQIQLFAQIISGRPLTVRESMEFTDFAEQTGVYE